MQHFDSCFYTVLTAIFSGSNFAVELFFLDFKITLTFLHEFSKKVYRMSN